VAALVLVAAGGPLLIQVLLERGHFTAADTQAGSQSLARADAGFAWCDLGYFLARLFQAQQHIWVIFTLGCVSVVANVAFAVVFLPLWGVVGVAVRKFSRVYADHVVVPPAH